MSKVTDFSWNGIKFSVDINDSDASFWNSFMAENWEPITFAVMRDVLEVGETYIDIGSWIGPTILLAATKAGRIQGFEPDPLAFSKLQRNLELNSYLLGKKVTIHQAALADRDGELELVAPDEGGGSTSSIILREGKNRWTVKTLDAMRILSEAGLTAHSLVKMDIEGGEYVAIPRVARLLKEIRPTLYLSLHPFNISGGWLKKMIMSYKLMRCLRHYSYVFTYYQGKGWIRCTRLETYLHLGLPMRLPLDGAYVFSDRLI